MNPSPSQRERLRRCADWVPWLAAAAALAPYLILHCLFRELFWFGDEWDLLDQVDRLGIWAWTWQAFAENYVPVFKLAWSGLVHAGHGSYSTMLAVLWLTHALNALLLGRWLLNSGFGWITAGFSALVFAVTAGNLETLGWGVQWSAVLATTFFLLAAVALPRTDESRPWRFAVLGLVAASALSFSRGVLSGPAIGCLSFFEERPGSSRIRRIGRAACYLIPSAAVALLISQYASGNHTHLGNRETLVSAARFGTWYFCLNPFYRLAELSAWGPGVTLGLGLIKCCLIGGVLALARGPRRPVLATLVLLDLGNAVLLGIGRYHTGLESTISSRYQYASLISTLPFLGYAAEALLGRLRRRWLAVALGTGLVVGGSLWTAREWKTDMEGWTASRGRRTRDLLFREAHPPDTGAVPGIPYMSTQRAKELTAIFHLH